SLAGELLAEGFDCLATDGCFVEIGQRDIWTADQAHDYRPDVRYHSFDLGQIASDDPGVFDALRGDVLGNLDTGRLAPLPVMEYDFADCQGALLAMQHGRHRGKIVLARRQAPPLRHDGCYLVTGGLGGLGVAVAGHLLARGAGSLVLCGRAIDPDRAAAVRDDLLRRASETEIQDTNPPAIHFWACDISAPEQVAQLLARLDGEQLKLAGIFHCAGVRDDALLAQQSPSQLARVMAPKVSGAWHLHRLTRARHLDHFVLFSSAATLIGSSGQAGYVAGNCFMDALVQLRRSQGLAGLAINWGPWAEVGMAAGLEAGQRQRIASRGLDFMTPAFALDHLDMVLRSGVAQALVARADWTALTAALGPQPLWRDLVAGDRSARLEPGVASARAAQSRSLAEILASARPDERVDLVERVIADALHQVLGIRPESARESRKGFFDMGMDSLTAMEFRNDLQQRTGLSLPRTIAFDHGTIHALREYLLHEGFALSSDRDAAPDDLGGAVGGD
ncbi:MAG: SDR family NAD(P)-dependent oxidoreductase, partial [Myxococcota bacterium]